MGLIIPHDYGVYRAFGIDPGLNHTGLAVFTVDARASQILSIEPFTLSNHKLDDLTGLDPLYHHERTIKLYKLRQEVAWYLNWYKPVLVGCEAPFYNRLMPMAYGALMEVVTHVHTAVIEYNASVPFVTMAPLVVKKQIGAKAVKNDTLKGKELVKHAMSTQSEIVNVLETPLENLTEHAIDAVAVGYTLLKQGEWL